MKKLIIICLSILVFASCNDWLTVTPKGQVEAEDLLKDEKGYNSALAGVYYTLSSSPLYGREMTYSMMDLLAQYWDIANNTSHNYRDIVKYDYSGTYAKSVIGSIWKNLYTAISQCNRILESLEHNRRSIEYSELMESEALALRAFCHMELFRLFGPVIRQAGDLDKKAIAYRTKFDVVALEFESGKSILNKVKRDLTDALALAANDPIKTQGRKGDGNASRLDYNDVIAYRGGRMNYFAILGMLARTEQLLLNQEGAYTYATRIISELEEYPVLAFVTKENLELNEVFRDYIYSAEMLFGLNNWNLYDMTNPTFYMNNEITGNANIAFPITTTLYETFLNQIYALEGGGTDNRLRYWFERQASGTYYDITKLRKAIRGANMAAPYDPEIPVMRLSEVYYIACEAQIGKNNTLALSYLNKVRDARNLTAITGDVTDESLLLSLVRDMRKEFIGEGRMFPAYKRLYYPIYVKTGVTVLPTDAMFVFPIPDAEYEYSPNEKPVN